ncbi:hypothetical protein LINPERHAP1_LOCUS27656 [Linum perenne]
MRSMDIRVDACHVVLGNILAVVENVDVFLVGHVTERDSVGLARCENRLEKGAGGL